MQRLGQIMSELETNNGFSELVIQSVAVGSYNTVNSGVGYAIGRTNILTAPYCNAMGYNNTCSGAYSVDIINLLELNEDLNCDNIKQTKSICVKNLIFMRPLIYSCTKVYKVETGFSPKVELIE